MIRDDPKPPAHRALRLAAVSALAVQAAEMVSWLLRWRAVPPLLPWRMLALDLLLIIPLGAAILALDRVARRLGPDAGAGGWMGSLGFMLALTAGRDFHLAAVAMGAAGAVAAALALNRLLGRRGAIGAWAVAAGAFAASLLAKGNLLVTSGWRTAGWAVAWVLVAAALLALSRQSGSGGWGRAPAVLALVALAATLASSLVPARGVPGPRAGDAKPGADILLVVLDSVRWEAVERSVRGQGPMPRLAAMVREGRFAGGPAVAPSASSLESHATLFTGRPVSAHGAHKPSATEPDPPWYAHPLPAEAVTLAERLKKAGYATMAVSGNYGPLDPAFGLAQGFDFYDVDRNNAFRGVEKTLLQRFLPFRLLQERLPFNLFGYDACTPYRNAEHISRRAVQALRAARGRPFFLFVNLFDAHSPYVPPDYWRLRGSRAGWDWLTGGEPPASRHRALVEGGRGLSEGERDFLRALYDSQLAYLDGWFAHLLGAVDRRRTLVLVLSDHGESLGEHSLLKHSESVLQPQVLVPLLAGLPSGEAWRHLAAGGPPADFLQAHDLVLQAAGLSPPRRPEPPGAVSEVWSAAHPRGEGPRREVFRGEVKCLVQPPLKLIWASDGRHQLFDLAADPGELRDLAPARPDDVRRMAGELEAYLELAAGGRGSGRPLARGRAGS